MDKENDIQSPLSSLHSDFVVLSFNSNDEFSSLYSDVEVSDKNMTMIDEKNLIHSYELMMIENNNLKEKIKAMNQKLAQRIDEMKEMKSAQLKWREINEVNCQMAKEETLRLRDENKAYKQRLDKIVEENQLLVQGIDEMKDMKSAQLKWRGINEVNHQRAKEEILRLRDENKAYQQRNDKIFEDLGQIIQMEMDPEFKKQLEHISLQIKAGVQQETKEEGSEKSEVEQTEANDSEPTGMKEKGEQTEADEITKLNMIIAEMTEQLNCKDEQIDMIARELSEMKIEKQKMVEVSNALAKAVNETSVATPENSQEVLALREECDKVKSINTQLNKNLQKVHTKIEALKAADATSYQQMQKENSRETVWNLMMLFRAERQKCTSLQEKLTKESKRAHDLEMDLLVTQQELESKDSKLDKELSKREKEHKITVQELYKKLDELSQKLENTQEPQYQSTDENMHAQRSQFMALMAELKEKTKQVEDASMPNQKRNERIKNLEVKNAVIGSEQYGQGMQYTAFIDRLQLEIKQLSEKVKGYEEVVEEKNELLKKFQLLEELYQDICHKYKEIKHKAVDEKEPRYQSNGKNMCKLRSTIMVLMARLEEKNKQFEDANVQIRKVNERIENLELKNAVSGSEQYNQSMQYIAVIDRLQEEIKQLSEKVKGYEEVIECLKQEIEQLGEKLKGYEEVVEEKNEQLMKFKQLQRLYQDVCCKYEEIKHKAVYEKEIEELLVKSSNC